MADRYATNQFYNFSSYEEGIGAFDNTQPTDNPQFLWPSNSYKNAVNGKEGNFPANTISVQRGYMRMITEAYGDTGTDLSKRRLHFQFNPETLTRIVTARNDVQLWQNQDPFQFTQPIPGDSNFSFDLMFNREAEVASAKYRDANGNVVRSNKAAEFSRTVRTTNPTAGHPSLKSSTTFVDNDYTQSWVTDIGVLADLMVFDQIIGQGMNKDLIEKIIAKAEKTTEAYNRSVGATEDESDKEIVVDFEKAGSYLGTNIGNSAFLVAQPIRVVFSSNFMVEGFVSSTNVVFNKFNASMVPTQCLIHVQMQALYIGFANKNTYLTQLFKEYKPEDSFGGNAKELEAQNKALKGYGNSLFNDFTVTNVEGDYNLNPKRIFNNDGDGISRFKINFVPTENFKTFAKSNLGKASATLKYTLTYQGRVSAPPSGGYAIGEDVIVDEKTMDLDMSSIKNGLDTVTYEITNPTPDVGKLWDTASNAKYTLNIIILFHLTGSSGGDVDANQIAKASKTLTYNETWYVANSLNTASYSDEQIAKERESA